MAVWTITGLTSTISVFNVYLDPVLESSHFFFISYLSIYLPCFFVILVSYTSIAVKIMCRNQTHHHGASNRERKLTKTLFIATVASFLLTLPLVISWSLPILNNSTSFQLTDFYIFSFGANSLVNPLLYAFRIPEFKRALLSLLRCGRQPEPAQVFPLNDR